MPEIQMTDLKSQVSLPETMSYSKPIKVKARADRQERYRQSNVDKESDRTSDNEVAQIMKPCGVRDNILTAHEKIMNGHYEEILNDQISKKQLLNQIDKYDSEKDTVHNSGDKNICFATDSETNNMGETSQNSETENEIPTTHDSSNAEERGGTKRLKDLISKEVLENLSPEQCEKIANEVIHCYDARVYYPIRPGQQETEVNVPIMSPPPVATEPRYEFGEFRTNFCRSLAAEFIKGHDLKPCKFASAKTDHLLKTLAFPSDVVEKPPCVCASQNIYDGSLKGWETPSKCSKSRSGKKRKSSRHSSDIAFSRLTGQVVYDKDPFSFQHFRDSKKYIEHYRFLNTVGGVCSERPLTSKSSRNAEEEAYYNKLRSAFCAMASSLDIRTLLQDRDNTSSSSSDKNDKAKSDDESIEDTNVDNKVLSMKDRGKTLNLAPVRECTVPDLIQADSIDQLQKNYATINQYLNLMTPPLPADCLRIAYEAAKARRHGSRVTNCENHLLTASNPRRGATPLRLGSAEFVKPGTPEQFAPPEVRWNNERKVTMQRSSTFHGGTVPGNLYVGSTVTTSPAHMGRLKSGGKPSSYILNRSHSPLQQQSKDAPHQIYGKKFKPCERVNELTKERGRRGEEKVVPMYQTSGTEQNNSYARKQDRLISVNVNNLGIRGRTFKPGELNVFFKFDKDKNRRVATLTSNI